MSQVLGHFKLVVILAVGVIAFDESSSAMRLAGMALALVGIVDYTALKQKVGSGWEDRGVRSSGRCKDAVGADRSNGGGISPRLSGRLTEAISGSQATFECARTASACSSSREDNDELRTVENSK